MRNIRYIVVHCTQTPPQTPLGVIKELTEIPRYHYVIQRDGEVERLLDDHKIAHGLYGHDCNSIHVAYIGGVDKKGNPADNRSMQQKHALFDTIVGLTEKYPLAKVIAQSELPNAEKNNPCFEVRAWLSDYTPELRTAA